MKHLFKLLCFLVLVLALASCGTKPDIAPSSSIVSNSSENTDTSSEAPISSKESTDNSSIAPNKNNSADTESHQHEWGKWIHDEFPNPETGELGQSHRTCKICKVVETKELTQEEVHHMFTTDGLIYLQ